MSQVESKIQQSCISWFRILHSKDGIIFSCPNGANVTDANRNRLVKEGMLSGVADLQILLKSGRCVFVEVKTPAKSSRQSPNQKQFEKDVKEFGFEYYIVRSLDEFRDLAKKILTY